jgi:Nif-specific regulatory protein
VLRDGEASGLLSKGLKPADSKGDILATSVICAPIRQDKRVVGLIHIYSTQDNRIPDPDDLEFTLAVADNVALALKNLQRQQELAENLHQTRTKSSSSASSLARKSR